MLKENREIKFVQSVTLIVMIDTKAKNKPNNFITPAFRYTSVMQSSKLLLLNIFWRHD